MPFHEYIILGSKFKLGKYVSVRVPYIWGTMSDREKVVFVLGLARRIAKERSRGQAGQFWTDARSLAWVTTPTFYDVGVFLFRNEMSYLEREGGYVVEKERIGGIRYDGKPRQWYRYRLIRTPDEKPATGTLNFE